MPLDAPIWPLMANNVTRQDLDCLIAYLSGDDPRLTHGPAVAQFEELWAAWVGTGFSVMVNSGSSANDLTMLALRHLKGAGEVVVPPLTWVSDVASVLHCGLRPRFVDIELDTLAPSAEAIADVVSPSTRAVFLTHVLGINALSEYHEELFQQHPELPLIEDVCESHGAMVGNRRAGSVGWASNFSFYYAHHLTTMEGGAVCTSDRELYETLRMLRSHGLVREISDPAIRAQLISASPDLNPEFIFRYAGHNMRPIELQAILGSSQLARLDERNEARRANFEFFLSHLNSDRYLTEFKLSGQSNYALILVMRAQNFQQRDRVETHLRDAGVEYRRGLSGGGNQLRQPYLRSAIGDLDLRQFPNVEHIHHFSWYIGNYPELDSERIEWLCELVNSI